MDSSFSLQRTHARGLQRGRGHCEAPRDLRRDAPRVRCRCKRWKEVQPAAPRCRYLVIVEDPDYCRAGAAFDARNFPHVSCRGETVQHREVERRPIGSAFGTAIAEHRWGLAGDLHGAVRHEPMLARCGWPLAPPRAQGEAEVLAKACHYYRLPPELLGLNRERPGAAPA